MEENQNDKEPKLSRGLKIFILAGTVFMIGFGIVYYATHNGDSEYFRTQIEPDSNFADKELVVKQDTARKDTAEVDSVNKEEEEQAKKVFNSIRGNVRHKTKPIDETEESETANESEATDANAASTTTTEPENSSSTSSSTKSEPAPKVEKIE